jgi:hypothetical protein
MNLYWNSVGSDEVVLRDAQRSLDYISRLGANSVIITFPLYTNGTTPTTVYSGPKTLAPSQLQIVARLAKQRGLRVTIRPIIDEENIAVDTVGDHIMWRGNIEPPHIKQWFTSYRKEVGRFVSSLDASSVDEVVVGAELSSLESAIDEWQWTTGFIKAMLDVTVSYAMNWDKIAGEIPVDSYGVDAYPRINLPDNASVNQLKVSIREWYDALPSFVRQNATLQEVGIPAANDIYSKPWQWQSDATGLNFNTQANWFAAMIQVALETGARGIYFWHVDSNVDPASANPTLDSTASFVGRPAEDVIRQSYGR